MKKLFVLTVAMLAVFILSFVYCVGDFCEEIPTFFAAGNNLRSEKDGFCYIVHAGGIFEANSYYLDYIKTEFEIDEDF